MSEKGSPAISGVARPQKKADGLRKCLKPFFKVPKQPRLADAGFTHDGQHLWLPLLQHALKGGLQVLQFRLAADHLGFHSLNAAQGPRQRPRPGAQHQIGFGSGRSCL